MLKHIFKFQLLVTSLAMVLMVAAPSFAHEEHGKQAATKVTHKSCQLADTLRDLWVDHIFWVRNVALMTRMGDNEGAKVAEENVVKNARAIADSVSPLYGKPASDKLFGLLAGHYGAVKEYMMASYAGDQPAKEAASNKMVANAKEIAGFLSGANPNWPKATLVSLLTAHGGHHMAQIDDLARKDYAGEAQVWEAMKEHMYMIADALAAGIVKQFPKKF